MSIKTTGFRLLNRIFNVNAEEWPKISLAFFIRFFYRVAFVIAWTVVMAMYIGRFGIKMLPYFFVVTAVFTILGSLVYTIILEKFSKTKVLIGTVIVAVLALFLSYFFAYGNELLFFSLVVMVIGVFMMQFRIILHGYIEELFTPLESERTFPLIESSETIGGIFAGGIIALFSGFIDSSNFVFLWSSMMLLTIPFILLYEAFRRKIRSLSDVRRDKNDVGVFTKLRNEFKYSKHVSFIKGLFLIVVLQWLLFNLMEFQYMAAVYNNLSSVVLEGGSGLEHAFIHDLGVLFMLFSTTALIVQFFLGSRLINSLGVIPSMILHAVVSVMSIVGLLFSFSFYTAVLAKNNFTISSIIHTNAYHSSYYAIKEDLREHTREFLEGFVRPLGAILGTLGLIALQALFTGGVLTFSVSVFMFIVAGFLLFVSYRQQKNYTNVALFDLMHSKFSASRMNALDILAQRGHRKSYWAIKKIFLDKNESNSIRTKALIAVTELQLVSALPDVVKLLGDQHLAVRKAALDTILRQEKLNDYLNNHILFARDLISTLKHLYMKDSNHEICSKVVTLMSKISATSAIDFLLGILKKTRGDLKVHVMLSLGNFNDLSIKKYIEPYLESRNLSYRVAAIICLGKLSKKKGLLTQIDELLDSKSQAVVAQGHYAIGELGIRSRARDCIKALHSHNDKIKMHAAIALAKMGMRDGTGVLCELMFSKKKVSDSVKRMMQDVDIKIAKNVEKVAYSIASRKVDELLSSSQGRAVGDFDMRDLHRLRWLYGLVGELDEVEIIDNLVKMKA